MPSIFNDDAPKDAQGNPLLACNGSVVLKVWGDTPASGGSQGNTYEWYKDGQPTGIHSVPFMATAPGKYKAQVK
jgi:hypothetical protein